MEVKLEETNVYYSRGFMAHYIMLFGMILRDIEMFKSQKVTCTYPYIPAYLEETEISDKDVQSILAWCADVQILINILLTSSGWVTGAP